MTPTYDFQALKEAILFNTVETLPTDHTQLDDEVRALIEESKLSGQPIRHYIGFEISGQVHIGTGISSALKIKKLQDASVVCSIWLADYHTWLNEKLDGKLETICHVARDYFGPVMLKCCEVVGCDVDSLELLYAEKTYETKRDGHSFWTLDMKIGKELTLNRVMKSVSIMGKDAGDSVDFGTLRYPVMQVSDAFFMQTHLVHAGIDQRKCHVLMREIAPKLDDEFALKIGKKRIKPIAIHHSLLLGLEAPKELFEPVQEKVEIVEEIISDFGSIVDVTAIELQNLPSKFEASKMSKSKPDSAVWVHDSEEEILRKLKKAYCPMPVPEHNLEEKQSQQQWNPLLDWSKNMIFPAGQKIQVVRPEKFGGDELYETYEQLEADYFEGKLHPMDLKTGVGQTLATWFSPIREYVEKNPKGLELVRNARK